MVPKTLKEILDPKFHQKMFKTVEDDFNDYLQELREEDEFSSEIISAEFTNFVTNTSLNGSNITKSPPSRSVSFVG